MSKAIVNPGVCGFVTEITVESEDMATAVLKVSSDCPAYSHMKDNSYDMDTFACCFSKIGQNPIYDLFRETCRHAACPIPMAALKALEVACELALPRDVSVTITK